MNTSSISPGTAAEHAREIQAGERFAFGANWKGFLETLDESKMIEARKSLCEMLGVETLANQRFLDVGCGSGLFSLAARQLGAIVHSFDYDTDSVGCAQILRERFYKDDPDWVIEQGSVLDEDYLRGLGAYDVVYSWGVLHHTGDMWGALQNVIIPVKQGGQLCIAIYNDEGRMSVVWKSIKRFYCSSILGRMCVTAAFVPPYFMTALALSLFRYHNLTGYFSEYRRKRGMSVYHDWIDWLGGYPFEVAKPEELFEFYKARGYGLEKLKTTNRLGCNQLTFRDRART